jgi:thymidylate synthase ThyX
LKAVICRNGVVAVVAVEEKKKRDAIKWHPFFFEKFEKYKRCRKESTQMFSRNNFHVKKDRRYCPLLPSTQTTTTFV